MAISTKKKDARNQSKDKIVGIEVGELSRDMTPYSKADVIRACRLSNDFAVSFYQVNYQLLVDQFANTSQKEEPQTEQVPLAILVGRVVMNRSTFLQLAGGLLDIAEKIGISIDEIRESAKEVIINE